MELTERIDIQAPVDDVFDAWVQLERAPEYAASVIERRRLDGGPLGVGATYHAVDRWPGGDVAYTSASPPSSGRSEPPPPAPTRSAAGGTPSSSRPRARPS